MTQISSGMLITPQELFLSSPNQEARLGTIAETSDGRRFRYVQNGATEMIVGNLQQAAVEITDHQNLVPAAAAVGDTTIDVKLSSTGSGPNEYAEGWLVVTTNAGEGHQYAISGHALVASGGTITLQLADAIEVALTVDSKVDLSRNSFKATVINPTTATSTPIGVALHNIGASEFGYLQTTGPVAIRAKGALVVGSGCIASTGVAGGMSTQIGAVLQPALAYALTGIADSEYGMAWLSIG